MPDLKIVMTPLEKLKGYENNARTHSEEQVDDIARSIEKFGFLNPILVDGEGEIIAGHGRYAAASKLGLKKVPTIDASHLSEEQVRLYRIADNRIAEKSEWNKDLLKLEFEQILELGTETDLSITGWDFPKLQELLATPDQVVDEATATEWKEMPSFDHKDESAFFAVKVSFANAEAVADFAKLIGQDISVGEGKDRRYIKSIWHPKAEIRTMMDKRYDSEAKE